MSGQAGIDTATYATRFTPVQVSLDSVGNDGAVAEGDNVAPDTENIDGGVAGDTLIGDASANHLTGGPGEDYIDGASGGDIIAGGDSADVLRSRNGTPDSVTCEPNSSDYVIADGTDGVDPNCAKSRVDRGVNQKPRVGAAEVIRPVSGSLQMSPSGIHRLVPLHDTLVLPTQSLVDAGRGTISLLGKAGGTRTQSGQFHGGAFRFTQTKGRNPLTELSLAGGNLSSCPLKRPVAGAASSRQLFGKAHGHFRTRGRHSTATVRGTAWLTKDTCSGTLTQVQSGTVVVRDLTKHRTVVLHTGQRYFARRGNR
jgi:hypothetical protein